MATETRTSDVTHSTATTATKIATAATAKAATCTGATVEIIAGEHAKAITRPAAAANSDSVLEDTAVAIDPADAWDAATVGIAAVEHATADAAAMLGEITKATNAFVIEKTAVGIAAVEHATADADAMLGKIANATNASTIEKTASADAGLALATAKANSDAALGTSNRSAPSSKRPNNKIDGATVDADAMLEPERAKATDTLRNSKQTAPSCKRPNNKININGASAKYPRDRLDVHVEKTVLAAFKASTSWASC